MHSSSEMLPFSCVDFGFHSDEIHSEAREIVGGVNGADVGQGVISWAGTGKLLCQMKLAGLGVTARPEGAGGDEGRKDSIQVAFPMN